MGYPGHPFKTTPDGADFCFSFLSWQPNKLTASGVLSKLALPAVRLQLPHIGKSCSGNGAVGLLTSEFDCSMFALSATLDCRRPQVEWLSVPIHT